MTYAELESMINNAVAKSVMTFHRGGKAPTAAAKAPAADDLRSKRLASLEKARAAKKAKKSTGKAKPAVSVKAAVKAKPEPVAVEGVECGGLEFRKGSTTKQGREYVLLYVDGVYAGSIRTDDIDLLAAVVTGLRHKDVADAIALACE
jgi:hypothetical protein